MADAVIKITVDGGDLAADVLAKVGTSMQDLGGHATTTSSELTSFGHAITEGLEHPLDFAKGQLVAVSEQLGPLGVGLVAAAGAAVAAGTAIYELADRAAVVGGQLNDMAEKTGMTVPALSKLSLASQVAGSDLDTMARALFMFEKNLGEGTDKFAEGLSRIGLSVADVKASGPDQWLALIAEHLKTIEDPSQRAAAAMELFGRQGREIIPTLMKLDESLALTGDIQPWTAEQAKQAEQFEMQMKSLVVHAEAFGTAVGRDLIEPISTFVSGIVSAGKTVNDFLDLSGGLVPMLQTMAEAWRTGAAAIDTFRGSATEVPTVSGDAARGVKAWHDEVDGLQLAIPTLDQALANDRKEHDALDEQIKTSIATKIKYQATVDGIVAALDGEIRKSGETAAAIRQVIASHTDNADVIMRVVGAIDKLYDSGAHVTDEMLIWADANRVVKGTVDALHGSLSELTVAVPENTQHLADMRDVLQEAHDNVGNLTSSVNAFNGGITIAGDELNSTTIPAFAELVGEIQDGHKAIDDIVNQPLDNAFKGWTKDLSELSSAFGQLAQVSGGSFGAVVSDIAQVTKSLETVSKGMATFEQGVESGNVAQEATGAASGVAGVASATEGGGAKGILGGAAAGALMGAEIGSIVPGIGTAIGAVVGGIAGAVIGIARSFGASEAEKAGRVVEADFEQQFGGFQKMMDAVGAAYAATGRTATQAQADVKALMDAEVRGGQAATDAANKIKLAFAEQQQDAKDLDAAVQRYGFSIAELGPTMQKQQLDAQAQQLLNDWRLLVGSGMDIVTVDQHMASSMAAYLTVAKQTGQEVPAAMQPVLQKMIDQGLLTDANGDKITDMTGLGVTFSKTMTEGFQSVVDKLDQLLQKIGMVPAAIAAIPTSIDVSANVHYNDPGLPRAEDTYAASGGFVGAHRVEYFAGGGFPGGPRGTDTVPIWATPGEMILNRGQQTSMFGGTQALASQMDALHVTFKQVQQQLRDLPSMLTRCLRDAKVLA